MDRMMSKKIIVAIIIASAISLAFWSSTAYAQDDAINNKIAETKDDVTKLLMVQDSTIMTDTQKEQTIMDLKRKIISNILDISLNQAQSTLDQINTLNFADVTDWTNVKSYLTNQLNSGISYYKDMKSKLGDVQGGTLQGLNDLAKKIESQKTSTIDPIIQRANVVIATVNISDIISVADDRLTKVSSDVEKIYSKKLTKNTALKDLLNQATAFVKASHELQDQAQSVTINIYTTDMSTSTKEFLATLKDKIQKSKEDALLTSASTTDILATPSVTQDDLDNYLANLTTSAYDNIKAAYDVFVKMSVNVKKYLQ